MTRATAAPWDERVENEWAHEIAVQEGRKHAPEVLEASTRVTKELRTLALGRLAGEKPFDATLPLVAQRIYLLSSDPNTTNEQIAKLAASDPPLAGRLIELANNAFYGRGPCCDSLQNAILRVGLGSIRTSLIMPVLQARLVRDPISASLWRHSSLVAATAPFIASLAKVKPDLAQLGGLLHDIGRILIWMDAQRLVNQYGDLLNASAAVLHEEIGTLVLERWKMPGEIVAAVADHHTPSPAANKLPWQRLAHVICIADALARAHEDGVELDPLTIPSVEALGIPTTPIVALSKRMAKLAEGL